MIEFCFESINWAPYFAPPRDARASVAPSLPGATRMIRAAADAGFDWISFDETLLDADRRSGRSLESLRAHVDAAGLEVLALHSIALGEDIAAATQTARALADAARVLGAAWVQVGATAPLGPALFETARAVASIVAESDARLAIEFLPFLDIASIADTRRLIDALPPNSAAIVPDTWHFFHGPDDWDTLASLRVDEIAYLQFDDHPALVSEDLLAETTQRRVLPGKGEFDLDRFATTLTSLGFDGVVGLEHLSAVDRVRPVEDVAQELMAAARRYWIDPASCD